MFQNELKEVSRLGYECLTCLNHIVTFSVGRGARASTTRTLSTVTFITSREIATLCKVVTPSKTFPMITI